jgi:signal peptidase II
VGPHAWSAFHTLSVMRYVNCEFAMKRKYWILLIVSVAVLGLDQWTKYVVQKTLPLSQNLRVIPGFFNVTHVRNTGGAFGILGGQKGGVGSLLFVVVSGIAVGILFWLVVKLKKNGKLLAASYALVLSGALGNLIDRLRIGEVIDFLDFYVASFHWPAFNIADSAICVGIGLVALDLWGKEKTKGSSTSISHRQGRR